MNNDNKEVNENYGNFNSIFNTIRKYIKFTLNSDTQINIYVPNTHIAEIFREVLQACEKESMYPHIYHNITEGGYDTVVDTSKYDYIDGKYYHKEKGRISFIDYIDDYFNSKRLNANGIDEITRVYQKLREKRDIIRNNLKLINTRIPDEYNMTHKVKRDLRSDRIRIK